MSKTQRRIKIAPSILSADFANLGDEIRSVLDAGADYIHVDVMDGMFVPNITVGVPILTSLRKAFPDVFMDVHLMIERPERYVEALANCGSDLLMFHVESDTAAGIDLALRKAWRCGVKTGLAVSPKTEPEAIAPWLSAMDMVLVMTVEPGFGKQRFMDDQLAKIRKLRAMLDDVNPECDLEVDGGINAETAPRVIEAGANVLAVGSAIFDSADRAEVVRRLSAPRGAGTES